MPAGPKRFEISLEGFPPASFAEGHVFTDGDGAEHIVTDAETAWDAYKCKHPQARRRFHANEPKVKAAHDKPDLLK